MAIGPAASRMASGRVVVVAGFYGILGVIAFVLGIGPIAVDADAVSRALGVGAMATGAVLCSCAVLLLRRRPSSRAAGLLGGVLSTVVGVLVALAAVVSVLGRCPASRTPDEACQPVEIVLVFVGAAIAVAGVASVTTISRTRRSYFTRYRRR